LSSYVAVRSPLQLTAPYDLSFAKLTRFDSYYVKLETSVGAGYGEITPLPGYSDETPASVERALVEIGAMLRAGTQISDIVAALLPRAPMVGSALACAMETAALGVDEAFSRPMPSIPLVAICQGASSADMAREAERLSRAGYATLKIKVGVRPVADDLERLRAVAAWIGPAGRIRIDANQSLGVDAARALVAGLAGLPIELFEQPFPPAMDAEMKPLSAASPVPLMLDESINVADDIDRASALGVRYVKLKLCKHSGLGGTRAMIDYARRRGLALVFGNGVQSALGNRLEARLHRECAITSASEANGFLKVAASPFRETMRAEQGMLVDGGLGDPGAPFEASAHVAAWATEPLFTA
jgi:L-alanine-DL-glutamate epimerase-like enolase superfamily enzyme